MCVYDKQRALYEDPRLINTWFQLVDNIYAKYTINNTDFYNFNKTSFIIGIIYSSIVVIGTN